MFIVLLKKSTFNDSAIDIFLTAKYSNNNDKKYNQVKNTSSISTQNTYGCRLMDV